MLRRLLSFFIVVFCIAVSPYTFADDASDDAVATYDQTQQPIDQAQMVSQQIDLLKNRLVQAKNEVDNLKRKQEKQLDSLSTDRLSKQLLEQTGLDISIAQSNLDSIDIELSEAQQTLSRVEKHIQDLENQVNILNIFGLKISRNSASNVVALQLEAKEQHHLLELEKSRADYLEQLKDALAATLQLHQDEYRHIEMLLKSRTMMRLREEQAASEMSYQRQQTYWLQQLNDLYSQLNQAESQKNSAPAAISKLESEIFFANENVTYTYLQTMIARYQDQLHQYKVSIARSSSIGLLNKISDQTQLLGKELTRVTELLKNRIEILNQRKLFLSQNKENPEQNTSDMTGLANMTTQYQTALSQVADLNQQLVAFHVTLDQALQQELSSRQGLPGLGASAWLDLGEEVLWVPTLTFQVGKSLVETTYHGVKRIKLAGIGVLLFLELGWFALCYVAYRALTKSISKMTDQEAGHLSLKWLGFQIMRRNLIAIAVLVNMVGLFALFGVPEQNFSFLVNLGLVWIFFKILLSIARCVLIETVNHHDGHDVKLYKRLRLMLVLGGVVTGLTVFLNQLPVIYEIKDLFDRLFLFFLLIASTFLLRAWYVVPGLILPYIDKRHNDLKRIVRLLGVFIPLILFVNSAIGVFGYVNLVLTISWYQSIFLCVLVGYLILRGILVNTMEKISHIVIRNMTNGWLWTEAFLKPIDKVFRVILFLFAGTVLFIIYGWDQQSPVVERLTRLMHYRLVSVLNTTITPQNIIEVLIVISLLFWAAKWTREFVYRLLLSRTKDLGLRNSIAILSQYATIVLGLFLCLAILGIDFRALAVVASAFAFGVGLGLRDLFNNFACGFLLLLERPLRVGDTVTINEIEGEVIHIGGRAVTVRTDDHIELLVPNAEIFSKNFINWTVRDNVVRGVCSIEINITDNPHEVQNIIYDVLAAHKDVLKEPLPEVFIAEMAHGACRFEVRYFLNMRQVRSRQGMRSEILAKIWDAFEQHGVKPCYPHREVLLKNS